MTESTATDILLELRELRKVQEERWKIQEEEIRNSKRFITVEGFDFGGSYTIKVLMITGIGTFKCNDDRCSRWHYTIKTLFGDFDATRESWLSVRELLGYDCTIPEEEIVSGIPN